MGKDHVIHVAVGSQMILCIFIYF